MNREEALEKYADNKARINELKAGIIRIEKEQSRFKEFSSSYTYGA